MLIQSPGMKIWLIIGLVLVGFSILAAQAGGVLRGQILDPAGEPLPGANILIQHSFQGTTADLQGRFEFPDLAPANYTLVVSMMGYEKQVVRDIPVISGDIVERSITLRESVLNSPQVVVTSSRRQQDIMESPYTVVALGRRELADRGVTNLLEALTYEPGISAIKGQIDIRGASGYALGAGSRSLLLIDGVPQMGAASGNIGWDNVPTSEVDRVEVVKSGGSAMYGSSAMGGIINIITRNAPPEPETRVRARVGAYSQPRFEEWRWREDPGYLREFEVSHSRPLGDHAAWVRLQQRSSDGFLRLNWEEVWNLTGKLKLNFGSAHSAAVFVNAVRDDGGLLSDWLHPNQPFEAPAGSENDHTIGNRVTINGFYNRVYSEAAILKLRSGAYWNLWESFGKDPDYANEVRYFAESQVNRTWNSRFSTTAGLTAVQNGIEAQIFGDHTSGSLAAYALIESRVKAITVTAGSRFESYRVDDGASDGVFAPQFAVNWTPTPWLATRFSTGRGFRVPTVAEMFTRAQRSIFVVEPNPDLVAEHSVSREVGVTLRFGSAGVLDGLSLDAAFFRNDFDDLIEPTPDSTAIIHFENLSKARISGADIGLLASFFGNALELKSAYTWLVPLELDNAGNVLDTLSYRYPHQWITSIRGTRGSIHSEIEYRYAGRLAGVELYEENALTGQDKRIPVHVWNLGLGYTRGALELLLRVDNIFQYYYTQLERNIAEERLITLVTTYAF